MSYDYEESPYEDDEPKQATAVEILPPLKKQRSWQDVAIWAIVGLVAWHVVDRVGKAATPVTMQRADMVTENLPASSNVEDRRGAGEDSPPPRWHYGITPAWQRHRAANVWPGHDGSEIDEDEERELELEDARRAGREAARREADRPSRGFWPFFEAIDPGSQARHERYMAYTREKQRQSGSPGQLYPFCPPERDECWR